MKGQENEAEKKIGLEHLPLADLIAFLEGEGLNLPYAQLTGKPSIPAAYSPPAPATTLPGSPTDKQQAILVDSTSAPTYFWVFQYDAAVTAWLFIGGAPAIVEVATSESTTSNTYTALTTAGPSFTLPRAGTYDIAVRAHMSSPNASVDMAMAYDVGATAASDTWAARASESANPTQAETPSFKTRWAGLAANTVITSKYRSHPTGAYTTTFSERMLEITPVKVT